jgi:branched-chain amino acid transport system ATP-binding protein
MTVELGQDVTVRGGVKCLRVDAVESGYGKHTVLRDVSLTVDTGEIVSLIGHNGAGKSTLLATIAGLVKPTRGSVTFDERRLDQTHPADIAISGVGLVPQGRGIFPTLSIGENLRLGEAVAVDGRRANAVVDLDFVLDLFPALRGRLHEPAGTLSGGQQQMVAIGTALMTNPALLLLDEPSTGLAPILVQTMLNTIRVINEQLGMAVLMVEQNVQEALKISDRTYVLRLGELVRDGPSDELASDPDLWQLF